MTVDVNKLLGFAKAHPDTVASVVKVLAGAVEQNPAIVSDAITAIENHAPADFLKAHKELLAPLVQALAGEVFRNPQIIGSLLALA